MRTTVLLLALLALACGASAAEDLSSGDAPLVGAVLIARKVRSAIAIDRSQEGSAS